LVDLHALVAVLALAGALAPADALAAEDPLAQPVEALHAAINAPEVDAAANIFAEDAVVIVPRVGGLPQIYVGREQIRWWLSNLAAQHARFEVASAPRVDGHQVRWSDAFSVDAFTQLGLSSVEVDADAVLTSDRHIASLTLVLTPEAARNLAAAPGSASAPANRDQDSSLGPLVLAAALVCVGFGGGLASALVLKGRRLASFGGGQRVRSDERATWHETRHPGQADIHRMNVPES